MEERENRRLIEEMFSILAENVTEDSKLVGEKLFRLARNLGISLVDCGNFGLKLGIAKKKEGVFWPGDYQYKEHE